MDISFLSSVLPVVVAIVGIALTSYINIKLKFAKDENEAFRVIKKTFLMLALIFFNLWTVYFLCKEVVSSEPPTRQSNLLMVLYSLSLFWSVISGLFFRIIKLIGSLQSTQSIHLDAFISHVEMKKKVNGKKESKPS